MVTWTQMYMPMGGLGLSALVALIPIGNAANLLI